MATTLLDQLRSIVTIDVDAMDPEYARRHSQATKFCDMTSNQAIVLNEAIRPNNLNLIQEAIRYVKTKGENQAEELIVQDVIDTITVLLAKEVFPYLNGSVHAQTSPSLAHNTEETVAQAKRLVAIFEQHGIPKERVCIKIPATPESVLACQQLQSSGIQTLATSLFSIPQAVAASQAGCKYVAPYYNELRVHFDKSLWKEYSNPATEHPMSSVITSIIMAFRQIGSQTLVMPASIVTVDEVIALVSLRPDHITISGSLLDQLASRLPLEEHQLQQLQLPPTPDLDLTIGKDYLANGANALEEAINMDLEVSKKLQDALLIFDGCEKKLREFILSVL